MVVNHAPCCVLSNAGVLSLLRENERRCCRLRTARLNQDQFRGLLVRPTNADASLSYQFRREVQRLYLNVQFPKLCGITVHQFAQCFYVNYSDHLYL